MFVYVCYIFTLICISFSVNATEESSPFVFTFMESIFERMSTMKTKMEQMEKKITELESRPGDVRTPNVAFRAILSKNAGSVTTGQVISFDQVELNRGKAYSVQNGIFTAPYNGTYLFSMKLGNPSRKPGAFFLKHNGKGIEYVIAGHTSGWNVGGMATVVELYAGDKVWVQGEGHVSGAYATARYHTSFSGVLLNLNL